MVQTNIAAYLKHARGIAPQDSAAATINGASHDRQGYLSALLVAKNGAPSGTPTSYSVDAKIQDSADGSTGWADFAGASVTQITADDTDRAKAVDLSGAKRYIRVVVTVAFVGGTSPKVEVDADVILGGTDTLPAA